MGPAVLCAAMAFFPSPSPGTPPPAQFVVTTTADGVDGNPGDGACAATGLDGSPCTLRAAIMEANALPGDDTISVPAGTYTLTIAGSGEDLAATGDLDVSDNLTITGAGQSGGTVIDAGGIDRAFDIPPPDGGTAPTVTLENLTIQGGAPPAGQGGGGVRSAGTLTLDHVTVRNNQAVGSGAVIAGGGVDAVGGSLALQSSTISGNTVENLDDGDAQGGGIAAAESIDVTLSASSVLANSATVDSCSGDAYGGGIAVQGTLTATLSSVDDNGAHGQACDGGSGGAGEGGGIFGDSSSDVTLYGATVSGNAVDGNSPHGGGLALFGGAVISLDDGSGTGSTISGNSASTANGSSATGGGVYVNGGIVEIDFTAIHGNRLVASESSAPSGAGLDNDHGLVAIVESTVVSNSVDGDTAGNSSGGGITNDAPGCGCSDGPAMVIDFSAISGNSAAAGGGVMNMGSLEIVGSTIDHNAASEGGGIESDTVDASQLQLTVTDSTIAGNVATEEGGGISSYAVPLTVVGSTISGNKVTDPTNGVGGGLSLQGTETAQVDNSTISGNHAHEGGGIANIVGSLGAGTPILVLDGDTVAANTADQATQLDNAGQTQAVNTILGGTGTICGGSSPIDSSGNNLSQDSSCGLDAAGDQAGVDPQLAPLANNGGPTQTQALLPGSPAIDAGNSQQTATGPCFATDQRGIARPQGARCDIGAFEVEVAALPTLSVSDVSQAEGDSGTTAFTFTVSLSGSSESTVTVDAASADGTATAGTDYAALPATLVTFSPGQTSKTVTVNVNGDTTVEPDETFFVNLTNPSGATIADGQGQGTIQNDDTAPPPALSISSTARAEGNSGTTAFAFTVSLSAAAVSPVTVSYATADGTATAAGADYVAVPSTQLTFSAGQTSKTVTVSVNGDTTVEPDETFSVVLSSPSGATIADGTGTGTIQNDDSAALAVSDVSQAEGNSGTSAFAFTVSLTNPSASTVTVDWATADGTATAGSGDYVAVPGAVLSFSPGQTSKTVTVNVNGDTTVEPDETFSVVLSSPSGAAIGDGTGVGTILNDDVPTLSVSSVAKAEGNSGTTPFTFTIALSAASSSTVTVSYATADGTATAGSDYTPVASTLLAFSPGQTSKTVTVNVNGDTTVETDETFFVNLSSPANATILDAQGVGTIQNDDSAGTPPPPVPSLSISDYSHAEGNSGSTAFTFTVSLSASSASPVTVTFATADGTATAASGDYAAVPGTVLTFSAGQTSTTVTVNVKGDTAVEPAETFYVNLSSPSGASIADGQGVGTIQNDDAAPSSGASNNSAGSIRCLKLGTAGADILIARGLAARLCGLAGNDTITGGAGDDRLDGGPGNDTITGGGGLDHIFGGPGNDVISARDGRPDVIDGGPGYDTCICDPGDHTTNIERRR